VLVTGLPPEFRQERALAKLADYMPGGHERIWIARDVGTKLPNLYDRQVTACSKLEGAETSMIKGVMKRRQNAEQQFRKLERQNSKAKEPKGQEELQHTRQEIIQDYDAEKAGTIVDQLVTKKDRPTHKINKKLAWAPWGGQQTDTIQWCKQELVTVTDELKEQRSMLGKRPPGSSAFIRFHTQIAACVSPRQAGIA
jgi:hypothetical protein